MLSASAAIPAMIEVSFPAGFAPAEATLDVLNRTRCPINSGGPARSGQPHQRDQTHTRHEILVVEDRRGPRPNIR